MKATFESVCQLAAANEFVVTICPNNVIPLCNVVYISKNNTMIVIAHSVTDSNDFVVEYEFGRLSNVAKTFTCFCEAMEYVSNLIK